MVKPATLEQLSKFLFAKEELQRCCTDILSEVSKNNGNILLNDIYKKFLKLKSSDKNGKYYPRTISTVWVSLLKSGLIKRKRRGAPVQLSDKFSRSLNLISSYWRDYISSVRKKTE